MAVPYDFREIESRWQHRWDTDGLYEVDLERLAATGRKAFTNLAEFPYPSAEGLHVGHVFKWCGLDVIGRLRRMQGEAVFQPIGFDSFGINAENYAMTRGEHPARLIARTRQTFRKQLSSVGIGWDWSRAFATSDSAYYRWTQWIFVKLMRAGLAYQDEAPVTWCPKCLTVLAREQTEDECCERCGTAVTERVLRQWFLRTTRYASRLDAGLATLDWPESAKAKQRNWIGLQPDGSMRLHDWLVSRQRFWGAPIPVIHCDRCGAVPVPENQLPVLLPEVEDPALIRPDQSGKSPLARFDEWVATECPACALPASRETDVLDTFVDSSWYFLRYPSTDIEGEPWSARRTATALPVGFYAGGPEHVTRHHLYARFVTMALYDLGLVPFEEPFPHMRVGGFVRMGGVKISKSKGNVIRPDDAVKTHGGDVVRVGLLFSGRWDADHDYEANGFVGAERFLTRVWKLISRPDSPNSDTDAMGRAVLRVTEQIEALAFNVAIARVMEFVGELEKAGADRAAKRTLVLLLAPFAPYLAEELWSQLGGAFSVHTQPWPSVHDETRRRLASADIEVAVQIDGRTRARVTMAGGLTPEEMERAVLASPAVADALDGKRPSRVVTVRDRLVNLVTTVQ
ncbi:MAG: class I tRNA ligase family protein [Actinobacteria bacterium]|nr:class I tRNA ligase family protein [Actinomycetota bacterium]